MGCVRPESLVRTFYLRRVKVAGLIFGRTASGGRARQTSRYHCYPTVEPRPLSSDVADDVAYRVNLSHPLTQHTRNVVACQLYFLQDC